VYRAASTIVVVRAEPDSAEGGLDQIERKTRLSRFVRERRPGGRDEAQLIGLGGYDERCRGNRQEKNRPGWAKAHTTRAG
jgi:hypothetical protein